MGAVIALMFKIPKRINSALMAFGGGALLFAVTIELYGHALNEYDEYVLCRPCLLLSFREQ